jgi:hypothetical protein
MRLVPSSTDTRTILRIRIDGSQAELVQRLAQLFDLKSTRPTVGILQNLPVR